jgi:hypothetical protein
MQKLTKKQRRERRKRREIERRKMRRLKLEKRKNRPKPWEPIKMKMFEIPNLFPPEMPKEKRLEIIRSMGEKAKKDFDLKYPTIQKWFDKYDPLYILSFCSLYFVSHPEGIDPEASGPLDFYHHYLEIMQAFALYQDRNFSPKLLLQEAEKLKQEMKEIGDLMKLRLFDIPKNFKLEKEISAFRLRTEMMVQTAAIRNWAYYHQMKRIVGDLSNFIKDDFEKIHGVDPLKLVGALFKLADERSDLLNEHLDKIRSFGRKNNYIEMIDAYNKAFPENQKIEGEKIEEIWNYAGRKMKNLRGMLMCHSDLKLEAVYSFDLNHFTSLYGEDGKKSDLKIILDKLSYKFGDLKNFKRDHIILDNPVHRRPFIVLGDDNYYSAIFGIMPHLILGLLEDLISENEDLRRKYSDEIKPKYLEDEIERLVRLHFPNAQIFRGSQWVDASDNKTYENDLTVIIDTFALIIEAKSGAVTPPAKRGAPDRLFETLKGLIEEPSEQAHRFIAYLDKNRGIHKFRNKRGEENIIDSTKINYFIPLGVTFAHLGLISSNLKKIIEAGITEKKIGDLAPSISLTDLESIFELLPFEAEKIHYFARRREIEDHINYEGDELDLLAFYLDNGFNVGDVEYSGKLAMNITMKSKELDPYFVGINEGVNVKKPELAMTDWWHDLLLYLTNRRPQNWIETSFILLNSTKEDQEKFEQAFKELNGRVKLGNVEKKHNWVAFLSGPERRRYFIGGYPYIITDKEERNNMVASILSSEETKNMRGSVVIAVDLNAPNYPYNVIAGKIDTDLFDILSSKNQK